MFNAQNPAPGVKVYGVPMPKAHVSQAVRLALRTPLMNCRGETVGVLRRHMSGGPQTVGMISTVRSLPLVVIPVRGRDKSVKDRPASRRRSPKMRVGNPVFQAAIPSHEKFRKHDAQKRLDKLRKMHWAILRYRGRHSRLIPQFDREGYAFKALYPEHVHELARIIRAQSDSIAY